MSCADGCAGTCGASAGPPPPQLALVIYSSTLLIRWPRAVRTIALILSFNFGFGPLSAEDLVDEDTALESMGVAVPETAAAKPANKYGDEEIEEEQVCHARTTARPPNNESMN